MKTSLTVAFTFASFVLTGSTVGHCGGPLARLIRCKSKPVCSTSVSNCVTATAAPCDVTMDQPSELNILLTTELVALRKQVEEMNAALAEKDQAIEDANSQITDLQGQTAEMKKKLAAQTARAKKANEELAKVREASAEAAKLASQADAKAKEQIKKLKQQNAGAKQRLDKAKRDLENANQALAKEKKEREDERSRQEKAIETPPAAVKEETAEAEADVVETPESE